MSLRPPLRALHIGVRKAIVITYEVSLDCNSQTHDIVGVLDLVLGQGRRAADVVEELASALHGASLAYESGLHEDQRRG